MKAFHFGDEPPDLYKFCPAEFDITNGCNTIRLGTLFGFRKEENKLLQDCGEGMYAYKVRFPQPTPISPEWAAEFEVGVGGSFHLGELRIDGGVISVTEFTLEGSAHNCWIFCVSMSSGAAGNISEAHPNKWKIKNACIRQFGEYISTLLLANITVEDLPQTLLQRHSLSEIQSGLSISCTMGPVIYEGREVLITHQDQLPIENIREIKSMIGNYKPERFKQEKEFRYSFWLNFRNERISIEDRPKLLKLRPVDSFL